MYILLKEALAFPDPSLCILCIKGAAPIIDRTLGVAPLNFCRGFAPWLSSLHHALIHLQFNRPSADAADSLFLS